MAVRDMPAWIRYVERRLGENGQAVGRTAAAVIERINDEVEKDFLRHPTAPIELTYQTSTFIDVLGRFSARLIFDFPDVTKATDGTDIEISRYELWGRDESLGPYRTTTAAVAGLAAPGLTLPSLSPTPAEYAADQTAVGAYVELDTSATSSFKTDGFSPGSIWRFKARAIGSRTVTPGEFSEDVLVQFVKDTTPPPQPTAPLLNIVRGTITVRWDGQAVTGSMPADFKYLSVAGGPASSPTTEIARFGRGGGFTVVSDFDYYKPQFFRFRAIDDAGNASPWSEQAVGYTTPLVDVDVILSKIDAAKTLLVNVDAGVSLLADTVATRHLLVTEDMTAALAEFLHVRAGMIEANAVEADKILAGAISAEKLEAELALLTRIIAGDPVGSRAEMDPDGFHVYASDGTEAVRMGTSSDDYFAVVTAAGEVAAAISQDGNISGQDVNVANELWIRGESWTDISKKMGRSHIGWGAWYSSPPPTAAQMGIFEITVDMYADRLYELNTSNVRIFTDTIPNKSHLRVRYSYAPLGTTPSTPGVGVDIIAQAEMQFATEDFQTIAINKITNPPQGTGTYRLLLCYSSEAGGGAETQAYGSTEYPIEMWVKDIGPYTTNLQRENPGQGVAVAPAPKKQDKTYYANGIMSYDGSGNMYLNSNMYQGLSPAGYGNLRSLATFPDMTADLSGATIDNIEVAMHFSHWFNNNGGTAYIGVHGNTSIPSTLAPPVSVVSSPGWPKPGSRVVQLPSTVWNNFKTGASRGITLNGDGTLNTYGYANNVSIKVTFSK